MECNVQEEDLYSDAYNDFLATIWGEGYLSPGGPEEVARILEGLDLKGARVLDIGCGTGGITVSLINDHGAAHVTGIDIEAPACATATQRAEAAGLADRITIREIEPGPFDFADRSFDLVFSKDSIIHISDKEALAADVFRVLEPGGWFAASDWLISHDGEPSADMKSYIAAEGLDFAMAPPARYESALKSAGFENVRLVNRNPWYAEVARHELDQMSGESYAELVERHGHDFVDHNIEIWEAMVKVLESGEHCPHHLRGQRPS
jgi:SAM-dependent methyltransferase